MAKSDEVLILCKTPMRPHPNVVHVKGDVNIVRRALAADFATVFVTLEDSHPLLLGRRVLKLPR
jgi:hypothetical protein